MSTPIIEVKNISKRYQLGAIGATRLRDDIERMWDRVTGRAPRLDEKEFWALRDVSFEVQPGEIVGIIGRNGAGKSTLLKILSRITEPTDGEIIMRGRVASLLEVGTGFHADLTGRENIFLNGAILGMTKAEIRSKLDEIIAFTEIETFIDTPVKRYSSGMYVKLAFAVAAHLEPEILIVDEVLAVGDAAFQKRCVAKMGEFAGQGRTVLFVSHNVGLISALCRTAVFLENGKVVHRGSVDKAINLYNNRSGVTRTFAAIGAAGKAGKPHISAVTLTGADGAAVIGPDTGYVIDIEASEARANMGVLVRVRNQNGLIVHYFNTAFSGDNDVRRTPTPRRYRLSVDKAGLPPGGYFIDVELWSIDGKLDTADSACDLDIADGFPGGRKAESFIGKCAAMADHAWEIT